MEKRLGRGLGSLLGGPQAPLERESEQEVSRDALREVALVEIRPNAAQPRRVFEVEGLQELRDSIRLHGVLQPIVLRQVDTGYELIAGERRWRAARLAGLDHIPAVVREGVGDAEMLELALVENVQRHDLNAVEKARGFRRMVEQLSLTQAEVAAKVGLKRATVTNHLRLLELPDVVLEGVGSGLLTMGHARALLGAGSPETQTALMERIAREGLSVRQTEQEARGQTTDLPGAMPSREASRDEIRQPPATEEPWVEELQRRIQVALGVKVKIQNGEGYRGKVVLEYYGREDLDRLLETLAPRETL